MLEALNLSAVMDDLGMGRTVCVANIVHPCRVKSFRKAVSAVMDDLGSEGRIIE